MPVQNEKKNIVNVEKGFWDENGEIWQNGRTKRAIGENETGDFTQNWKKEKHLSPKKQGEKANRKMKRMKIEETKRPD